MRHSQGDLAADQNGIVILGTPVGSPEFVQRFLDNRLTVQSRFWDRVKEVPDTQSAWLLLLYCAVPRANHLIRALPPESVAAYARAHDDGIWATFLDIIGYAPTARAAGASGQLPPDRANGESESESSGDDSAATAPGAAAQSCRVGACSRADLGGRGPPHLGPEPPDPVLEAARQIAFLPVVHGGLGLRSMSLLSPAAYWAAWADILPIIAERVPALADRVLPELERRDSAIACAAQAAAAEEAVAGPDFPQL